jgi:hypothetical protein
MIIGTRTNVIPQGPTVVRPRVKRRGKTGAMRYVRRQEVRTQQRVEAAERTDAKWASYYREEGAKRMEEGTGHVRNVKTPFHTIMNYSMVSIANVQILHIFTIFV